MHASVDQNVVEFALQDEADGINGANIIFRYRGVREARDPSSFAARIDPSWLRCLHGQYGFRWRPVYGEFSTLDLDKAM